MSGSLAVAPSGEMDDDMFVKHWNARHHTPGNGASVPAKVDGALPTVRAYHRRIHSIEVVVQGHEHRDPL